MLDLNVKTTAGGIAKGGRGAAFTTLTRATFIPPHLHVCAAILLSVWVSGHGSNAISLFGSKQCHSQDATHCILSFKSQFSRRESVSRQCEFTIAAFLPPRRQLCFTALSASHAGARSKTICSLPLGPRHPLICPRLAILRCFFFIFFFFFSSSRNAPPHSHTKQSACSRSLCESLGKTPKYFFGELEFRLARNHGNAHGSLFHYWRILLRGLP